MEDLKSMETQEKKTIMEEEIEEFLRKTRDSFVAPKKEYEMICMNYCRTICTRSFTISLEEGTSMYRGECSYVILRCDQSYHLAYTFPDAFENMDDVIHFFFKVLWDYIPCTECYNLTPKSDPLCSACYPSRIMILWGMTQHHITSIPTCAICFESVYHSRLHCGHYLHKTCANQLNPNMWYHYTTEIRCPLCRQEFNDQDRYDFFLYEF